MNAEPMLALAAALNFINTKDLESISLATNALTKNPNYISQEHQRSQLWGNSLRKATKALLRKPELQTIVERALANSD